MIKKLLCWWNGHNFGGYVAAIYDGDVNPDFDIYEGQRNPKFFFCKRCKSVISVKKGWN